MKRILVLSVLLVSSLAANAQTAILTNLWDGVKHSGILNATNYAPQAYVTYAPKLPKGTTKIGGGVLVPYNLNQNIGVALGVDYLGQFSMVSGNLTFQAPINFSLLGAELTFSPFVLGGIGEPMGGTSSTGVAAIEDAGAYLKFGHVLGGQFDIGGCYGAWQNAGKYSGERAHFFFGWSKKF